KPLRVQAGYQVCNAKSCSMPGQWTLPEAVVNVLAAGAGGSPSATVPKAASSPPGNGPEARAVAKPAPPSTSTPSVLSQVLPPSEVIPPSSAPPSAPASSTDGSSAGRSDTAAAAPAAARVQSEIAQKAQQGLIPFLIASALGGVFALLMPCVWPMIPITVNFFVKQGQGKAGRG